MKIPFCLRMTFPMRSAGNYDLGSDRNLENGRAWREDAMVSGEVGPWAGHECGEPCDEVLGTEQDVCRAVPERVLELVDHLPGGVG